MHRFLVDADTVADAVALVMALRHPGVRVEAITIVAGNVPVDQGVQWTCVGSVDCLRLRTVRGKENIATNKPDLPTGVSPRSYPVG
jgi:hypothetical protein